MSEGKQPQWSNLVQYAPKGILVLRYNIDLGEDPVEPGDYFDRGNKGGWRQQCNNCKGCVISPNSVFAGWEAKA